MLETFRNAWQIKELRKKILYTLMMLLIFCLGGVVPTPFVNVDAVAGAFSSTGLLGMVDMFNGGNLSQFTLLATGITPYITASIVIQLLASAIPALEKLQKEGGEEGKRKLNNIVRYLAIGLSAIQSLGYVLAFSAQAGEAGILTDNSWYVYVTIITVQAAGAAFAMWIGDSITENGIGNGVSLLIFAGIVGRLPITFLNDMLKTPITSISDLWTIPGQSINWVGAIGLLVITAALLFGIVYVDMGVRKIPVQYAKRMVGRRMYGGQSTHIPLKANNSGVMPLIFAMTLASFPGMIFMNFVSLDNGFGRFCRGYSEVMSNGALLYNIVLVILVIFFTYFYNQIAFNPVDISKNLQQYGGMIPGIRQGKPTADYLARISNRIALFSALFFAALAVIPAVLKAVTGLTSPFGATSILIIVSVALETSKQLEMQMLTRHYKGFLN